MSWIQYKIKEEKPEKEAEITIGDSRLTFGVSSCKLLNDPFFFTHVEFYKNPEKESVIGVRFIRALVKEETEQAVPLTYNKSDVEKKNGKIISLSVVGKEILKKVFGDIAVEPKSYKCKVKTGSDYQNFLEIDLSSKRIAKPGLHEGDEDINGTQKEELS